MLIKYFDEVKCFWMKSGTVDYRLCDNNFNCEKCLFNENIRNGMSASSTYNNGDNLELKTDDLTTIKELNFSNPYYHTKNGLLLKNLVFGIYYMGIDTYVYSFLTNDTEIELIYENDSVPEGVNFLSLTGSWGKLKLKSPLGFHFVEKFDFKKIIQNKSKWFGVIEVDSVKLESKKMTKADYDFKMMRFKDELLNTSQSNVAGSRSMYDGGEVIKNLSEIVDKKQYKKILSLLLKE